jgi:hypothetical protein
MDKERFYKLLENFKLAYKEVYKKTIAQKQAAEKHFDFCISSEEELLYFTLFSLKCGLTYDSLGLVCGMNTSNAQKNQTKGLKVLKKALEGYMPARTIETKAEFDKLFEEIDKLLIDATENAKQRPRKLSLPYKRKKNCVLTEKQKEHNKKIAQERIFVENSISGLKRYRILANKIRTHLIDLYDDMMAICAGLWNFYLSN